MPTLERPLHKTCLCVDCKKRKLLKDFSKRTTLAGTKTIGSVCKKCMMIRTYAWRDANRDKFNAYQRKYWKAKRANSLK
uniref:Uncharacterized protein n=1 Tax=viral metagenome TaxID=1070528 RepID=A0A6H1ZB03_9ZZZZ